MTLNDEKKYDFHILQQHPFYFLFLNYYFTPFVCKMSGVFENFFSKSSNINLLMFYFVFIQLSYLVMNILTWLSYQTKPGSNIC